MIGDEHWMNTRWRGAMAWQYMAVCITDFMLFPALWNATQLYLHQTLTQWNPITLASGGFYHLAMGAILGVAAWSRGKEKITAMSTGFNSQVAAYKETESQTPVK